jgi:hypothetical protein
MDTTKVSSQDTKSVLSTNRNSPFDFRAALQGGLNENYDSAAGDHVDGEPKRANLAFKKLCFEAMREVPAGTLCTPSAIVLGVISTL